MTMPVRSCLALGLCLCLSLVAAAAEPAPAQAVTPALDADGVVASLAQGHVPSGEAALRFAPVSVSRGARTIALPEGVVVHRSSERTEARFGSLALTLERDPVAPTTRLRITLAAPVSRGGESSAIALRAWASATFRMGERADVVDLSGRHAHAALRLRLASAQDAGGATLPAHFTTHDGDATLVIADHEARYPLTVEALLEASTWSFDGAQDDAFLGVTVAGGDLDGDAFADVVVGAFQFDAGQEDEGRAFAFRGGSAGLPSTPTWTAELNQAGAYFGRRMALVGDANGDGTGDLAVTATDWDGTQLREGRVLLYPGTSAGPAQNPLWSTTGGQAGASLGIALAAAGDVNGDGLADLIVGAPNWDGDATDAGQARVHLGSVATGLSLAPAWTYTGSQGQELLGAAVASAGDVNADGYDDVLVGAPNYKSAGSKVGRVLLFFGGPGGLAPTPAWTTLGVQADALFGGGVASAGDVDGDGHDDVLVAARLEDGLAIDEGVVRLYDGATLAPGVAPVWSMRGGQAGASAGIAATGVGDVNRDGFGDIAVGAFLWDADPDASAGDEGRLALYLGGPQGPTAEPAFEAAGEGPDTRFGYSCAPAGDVNGDSWPDVIVGAHTFDGVFRDEGRATVFFGPLIAPPPPLGDSLTITREGDDLRLTWLTPAPEEGAGPALFFRVKRDTDPSNAFSTIATPRLNVFVDENAALPSPRFYAYLVESENSGPLP